MRCRYRSEDFIEKTIEKMCSKVAFSWMQINRFPDHYQSIALVDEYKMSLSTYLCLHFISSNKDV